MPPSKLGMYQNIEVNLAASVWILIGFIISYQQLIQFLNFNINLSLVLI